MVLNNNKNDNNQHTNNNDNNHISRIWVEIGTRSFAGNGIVQG